MSSEIWKRISHAPSYEVSTNGRVRRALGGQGSVAGRIRLGVQDGFGYLRVGLHENGIKRMHRIHRLVAEAFLPLIDGKNEVNHLNGVKNDNRLANLEWCNRSENVLHAFREIRAKSHCGIKHPGARMTEEKVREIRAKHAAGEKIYMLAAEYGLTHSGLSQITHRRTWVHI